MNIFRNEGQRQRACRAMLVRGGRARFWSEREGSLTREAIAVIEGRELPGVGPDDDAILRAVGAFLGRGRGSMLHELVGLQGTEAIFKLAVACLYGHEAIDLWLQRADVEAYLPRTADDAVVHAAAASILDEARAVLQEDRDGISNWSAGPDACALGARLLADYAMILGVDRVPDDEERHRLAMELATEALTVFATISHRRALGRLDEDLARRGGPVKGEEPPPC
jgi:hypothetical protein